VKFKNASAAVESVKDLFSLPDIYFQLNEMIHDPRYSMVDIGAVIAKDPALSARLLRLVNSSFYSFQSPIDSISRAISIVGIDDLYNLVVATCVVDRFAKIPTDLVDMTAFWMRSVHCGVVTKLLGAQCAATNVERLFLCGLLHDIGSLVLYQVMPEDSARVLFAANHDRRRLLGLEQEIIGFTHAEMGRVLLQHWHLPDSLHDVVGFAMNPSALHMYKLDAHLLGLAIRLIDDREFGRSIEQTLADVPDASMAFMRLDAAQIEQVMQDSHDEFLEIFEQLLSD